VAFVSGAELGPEGPMEAASVEMNLSGTGRNFLWSTLPNFVTMLGSVFLLSYSIRRLGRVEYGAVITIGAATSILLLFSGALRYAVVRAGATPGSTLTADVLADGDEAAAIRAAHALFVFAAAVLVITGAAFGWLVPVDLGLHGPEALKVYVAAIISVTGAAVSLAVTAYVGVLTSQEQYGVVARIGLIGFATQAALTLLLAGPLHVIGLALASLASAVVASAVTYRRGRKRAPWLSLWPHRVRRAVVGPVLRYAAGLAILAATSTISSSSDAFVIGAVRGGGAVTIFRVGSAFPVSLVGLLYLSFGVLFPRIVRTANPQVQEEGVAWMGRVAGWSSGAIFACLCLAGQDLVRLLLGRSDLQATHVLWICAAALCVDVSYHGVVQVIFARGQAGFLAKYTGIELTVNLSATIVGVELYGPVGSALALAITIVVTDLIGFPFIMRGRWSRPAARFVWKNGVLQSIAGGAITLGLGFLPILRTYGLLIHGVIIGIDLFICLALGFVILGRPGRSRLLSLVRPSSFSINSTM